MNPTSRGPQPRGTVEVYHAAATAPPVPVSGRVEHPTPRPGTTIPADTIRVAIFLAVVLFVPAWLASLVH